MRTPQACVPATPATLASAFALAYPRVASVLFGATTPAQIAGNVSAAALLERLGGRPLAQLRRGPRLIAAAAPDRRATTA